MALGFLASGQHHRLSFLPICFLTGIGVISHFCAEAHPTAIHLSNVYGVPDVDYSKDRRIASGHPKSELGFRELRTSGTSRTSADNRRLSGETGSSPGSGICFLLDAIMLSALALRLTYSRIFKSLQFTVLVFLLGMLYALLHECDGWFQEFRGIFYDSYRVWVDINPHLFMTVFLPPLIMHESMTIDIGFVGRVYKQVLWLAGPLVLICTFLLAPVLYWFLGWEFYLCMATAVMWGATDPVAVMPLLRQLGVHPLLTAFIQGESLLNDGVAVIFFNIAVGVLRGLIKLSVPYVIIQITLKCFCSTALGLMIGFIFSKWIEFSADRFRHESELIQVSTSIACAYFSWMVAEEVYDGSGIISTVATGFVLADSMWPSICRPEVLKTIWHVIEYAFNAVIFFIAGALCGRAVWMRLLSSGLSSFWKLPVIWLILLLVRFLGLVVSWPILSWLSRDLLEITWKEICVMSWSGLRGAVSLCLAVLLISDDGEKPGRALANEIVFYTGGIACMTMVINAQFAPKFLDFIRLSGASDVGSWTISHMLEYISEFARVKFNDTALPECRQYSSKVFEKAFDNATKAFENHALNEKPAKTQSFAGSDLLNGAAAAQKYWRQVGKVPLRVAEFADTAFDDSFQELMESFPEAATKLDVLQHVCNTYTTQVKAEYQKMVNRGDFENRGALSRILLGSVSGVECRDGLEDLRYIFGSLRFETVSDSGKCNCGDDLPQYCSEEFRRKPLEERNNSVLAERSIFIVATVLVTLASTFYSLTLEENFDDSDVEYMPKVWFIFHALFCLCFLVEMVVTSAARRRRLNSYSANLLHIYDMLFTIAYCIELGVEVMIACSPDIKADRSNFRRIIRTLNIARVWRIMKLIPALSTVKRGERAHKVEDHLLCISALSAYVSAHCAALEHSSNYYLHPDGSMCKEAQICQLQSKTSVFRALTAIMQEASLVDRNLMRKLISMKHARHIVISVAELIDKSFEQHAVDKKQATMLASPFEIEREKLDGALTNMYGGISLRARSSNRHEEEVELARGF